MFALAGSIVSGVYNTVFGTGDENDQESKESEPKTSTSDKPSEPTQTLKISSRETANDVPQPYSSSLPLRDIENEYLANRSTTKPNNEISSRGNNNASLFSSYSMDCPSLSNSSLFQSSQSPSMASARSAFRRVDSPVTPSLSHSYTHSPSRVASPLRMSSPSRHLPQSSPSKISSHVCC
jgi:hypothetical protein